ncbi:MAG: YHS domain-containing protein [Ignavibacteria bacterium]|nr:YHS domain-containing protein [Ignavibacteria bacterium]
MDRDSVCGMEIKDTANSEAVVYKNKSYYFCSLLCKITFLQSLEKYVRKDYSDGHKHHHH